MGIFSDDIEQVVNLAVSEAARRGHEYVTVEHVLFALLENRTASKAIRACGGSIDATRRQIEDYFTEHASGGTLPAGKLPQPTLGFQRVIQRAMQHVRAAGKEKIHGENILVSIFSERDSFAVWFLQQQQITRFDLINFISHGVVKPGVDFEDDSDAESDGPPRLPPGRERNGGRGDREDDDEGGSEGDEAGEGEGEGPREGNGNERHSSRDPLALYAVDLCARARDGGIDPLVGREAEVERTVQVLCRRRKNNPLFVGDSGVGKTAIAEGIALRITSGDVPGPLKNASIYSLDMGALLAGSRFRGDFEQRLKGLIKSLKKKHKAILFIDEIHTVIGAGSVSGGTMDASNLLKPALTSGEIRCIGSTTFKEFRTHFETDHALVRRFQRIDVDEPSIADTVAILKGLKSRYEDHHQVTYSDGALRAAVELSAKYIRDRKLPDKAIDVIDEVGAAQALRTVAKAARDEARDAGTTASESNDAESNIGEASGARAGADAAGKGSARKRDGRDDFRPGLARGGKRRTITVDDIQTVVAKMARIPPQKISTTDKQSLAGLETKLKGVVFGQDAAIDAIVSAIKLSRSGLGPADRPIGSFLFTGPTGVGKTEVAKQLAAVQGIEFLRYDMSEYMERHAVSRLIGAPPGYVGFDQGGMLTDAVNKTPHAVLLLDEIEKAHPDVHNILLQVMDHGTLTDSNGRESDFRNVIIIMTTNAGARETLQGSIGFTRKPGDDTSQGEGTAIKDSFSPEFRNRLDAIITFAPLREETILRVVDKFLGELFDRLAAKKVIGKVTDTARKWLGAKGYQPAYGARPLNRLIQDQVKRPLADELLFGRLAKGGRVQIDVRDDKLVFDFG